MNKIRVMVIKLNGVSVVEVENTNKAINDLVSWDDAWNTPMVWCGGRPYIAICSDCGKMRGERISAVKGTQILNLHEGIKEPFLVGDIVITKYNGIDDFESLNDKDIEILYSRLSKTSFYIKKYFYKDVLMLD